MVWPSSLTKSSPLFDDQPLKRIAAGEAAVQGGVRVAGGRLIGEQDLHPELLGEAVERTRTWAGWGCRSGSAQRFGRCLGDCRRTRRRVGIAAVSARRATTCLEELGMDFLWFAGQARSARLQDGARRGKPPWRWKILCGGEEDAPVRGA